MVLDLGSSKRRGHSSLRSWITLALVSAALVVTSATRLRDVHGSPSIGDVDALSRELKNADSSVVLPGKRASQPPYKSDGYTDEVQWDQYSLIVKGQRIFLHSGEFHTFRLPVPSLWLDILQKVKATGMNAVSVYTHWGLLNPSPGVVDFDGFRALQPLFDAAKEAGIWIVLRPGPYINAETTAGGLAHWATTLPGDLRTNATGYRDAWQDYIKGIAELTAPNQITKGGPVIAVQIDNEYSQSGYGRPEYFQELEDAYRKYGIVVPFTYNDPGEGRSFINGTGAVDLYGVDAYPQRYDCLHPDVWNPVPTNYHDYHSTVNPWAPFYLPEFQGGSLISWGPGSPTYDGCQQLTGPAFEDVFYKSLWASNAKMMSFYMLYGGTSWGALPYYGVYTSYDYGGAISENRVLNVKHIELKRQGLFLRSSPEFYKTDWIGNSTTSAVNVSNPAVLVVFLSNPDTNAGFYIARQNDSTSTAISNFTLGVKTSVGSMTLPRFASTLTLAGRESKVILTDYSFGNSKVLYTTTSVLFAGRIGDRDVLFLHGNPTQEHEAVIAFTGKSSVQASSQISSSTMTASGKVFTSVRFNSGINSLVTLWDSETQLVLYSDSDTAGTFFSPVIPSSARSGDSATFKNFFGIGTNTSVLVGGPYLVRNATISGSQLALRGDLNESAPLTVIAPPQIKSITWNDKSVTIDTKSSSRLTQIGGFVSTLRTTVPPSSVKVPALTNWRYADSLPEVRPGFSDSNWVVANHTTTNIPYPMYYGDGRVLYDCDYGFCESVVLWRGHFKATGEEKFMNLSINGGAAFAASVWINDVFLNTSYGNSSNSHNLIEETDDKFFFPPGSLKLGQDNIVTVVQDNMGRNETGYTQNAPKSPRGIRGFMLDTGNFGEWKVQGKIGGYNNFPDKVRGVLNEGGTFGERQGWHLPDFDTSSWTKRSLSSGLPNSAAGLGFFVTTFDLSIPSGTDVPISFNFDNFDQPYRAYLFVNGWMMGKRVANLGPQTKFPVHEGILNYNGKNTVAVMLWAMEPNATITPTLSLSVDGVIEGGVGGITTNNPVWKKRTLLS